MKNKAKEAAAKAFQEEMKAKHALKPVFPNTPVTPPPVDDFYSPPMTPEQVDANNRAIAARLPLPIPRFIPT